MIASLDGATVVRDEIKGRLDEAEMLGRKLAQELRRKGGEEILKSIYGKV
jgi:hydroxymethylbilane synthase